VVCLSKDAALLLWSPRDAEVHPNTRGHADGVHGNSRARPKGTVCNQQLVWALCALGMN
jgi:hypothetical protein